MATPKYLSQKDLPESSFLRKHVLQMRLLTTWLVLVQRIVAGTCWTKLPVGKIVFQCWKSERILWNWWKTNSCENSRWTCVGQVKISSVTAAPLPQRKKKRIFLGDKFTCYAMIEDALQSSGIALLCLLCHLDADPRTVKNKLERVIACDLHNLSQGNHVYQVSSVTHAVFKVCFAHWRTYWSLNLSLAQTSYQRGIWVLEREG